MKQLPVGKTIYYSREKLDFKQLKYFMYLHFDSIGVFNDRRLGTVYEIQLTDDISRDSFHHLVNGNTVFIDDKPFVVKGIMSNPRINLKKGDWVGLVV